MAGQLAPQSEALPVMRYITCAQADRILKGKFRDRRPHVAQILVDLMGHADDKPVEFLIRSLREAIEELRGFKDENDFENSAQERLDNNVFSLHDVIAAGLLGDDVAARAGLLPPNAECSSDGPAMASPVGLKRGAHVLGCPSCSRE